MAYIIPTAVYSPIRSSLIRYSSILRHPHPIRTTLRPQPYLFPHHTPPPPPPPPPPTDASRNRPDPPDGTPFLAPLTALWRAYNSNLKKAPLLTKSISASFLIFLSDLCAQALTDTHDVPRLFRFGLYGMFLAGPMSHFWFLALDNMVKIHGPKAVLCKVLIDQIAYAPFATALFFAVMKTAEGLSTQDVTHFFQNHYGHAMLSNYKLWPLANMVNFALVPAPHRVVFTSLVSVFWISFLSVISNRPTVDMHGATQLP